MRIRTDYLLLTLIITISLLVACSDDEGTDNTEDNAFDRAVLLESLASDLIIPNFQSLEVSVNSLSDATNTFIDNTNEDNLEALQRAWSQAVIDHQHCSAFGFGPANLSLGAYSTVLGVFPVDESQIEANILDSNFNLAASFDRDVRGFYGVEYLIYGSGMSADVVAQFDQNRKDYLLLLVDELQTTFQGIVTEWQTSYLEEFIADDGTAAGSSISLLYNEFVKDYENLKNFKVELPAGLTAGQTGSDPSLVEAFYSGLSRDLIEEHFESTKHIWTGESRSGASITGLDDYLNSVTGGPELVATTLEAIDRIDDAIAGLPQGRLSDNVDAPELTTLRDELQGNTANFKSSMSSLLGISITFNSGDGD